MLYHFTCLHGYKAIGARGMLRPSRHQLLGIDVVWLTSEPYPDREQTGLTSRYLKCDRMAYRYLVADDAAAVAWLASDERRKASTALVADLESYGAPEEWWICSTPLRARVG